MKPFRLAAFLCGCALAAAAQGPRVAVPAGPPAGRTLIWVLEPDNKLAAYDAVDFRHWGDSGAKALTGIKASGALQAFVR